MNTAEEIQITVPKRIEVQLEELQTLWASDDAKGPEVFIYKLARWRQVTARIIEEGLGSKEKIDFESISRNIIHNRHDDEDEELTNTRQKLTAYLQALLDSVCAHPEMVIVPSVPSIAPAKAILPPEKVTLRWLADHVPIKLWVFLGTLLMGAFLIGFMARQTQTGKDVVKIIRSF